MHRRTLEKMLRQLPAAPPQTLKQRCMATIPVQSQASQDRVFIKAPMLKRPLRIAGFATVFMMVGLVLWITFTQEKQGKFRNQAGSAAFAQTLEAMQRVPFYHLHGRSRGYTFNNKVPQLLEWGSHNDWFDVQRGWYGEIHTRRGWYHEGRIPKNIVLRYLVLPDDTQYKCGPFSRTSDPDRYSCDIHSTDGMWEMMKSSEHLPQLLGQKGHGPFSEFTSAQPGKWKGQEVLVFTQEDDPPSIPKTGSTLDRTSYYVHPVTRLPVAVRSWIKFSDGKGWQLTNEQEFDFSQPNPSLFDPKPLVDGADQIRRLIKGHHVVVKQSDWAHEQKRKDAAR